MALTRSFKETVQKRAQPRSRISRRACCEEAIEALLRDELDVGKILLRDYINATVGFEDLAEATHKSPKSLMRMLSAEGKSASRQSLLRHRSSAEERGHRARRAKPRP